MKPMVALLGTALAVNGTAAQAGAADCKARSGERTTALVELYTSEGCSSCPPADRLLSGLKEMAARGSVVPLSLHVDYWNDLGWRDPFSDPNFGERQRRQSRLSGTNAIYTPEFMLQGRPVGLDRSDSALPERIRAISRQPARADLELEIRADNDALATEIRTATREQAPSKAVLYVVLFESGLASEVKAGENRGASLRHDFVVRAWRGPLNLSAGDTQTVIRLPLNPAWRRDQLGIAAFVEDSVSGEVLQAIAQSACN